MSKLKYLIPLLLIVLSGCSATNNSTVHSNSESKPSTSNRVIIKSADVTLEVPEISASTKAIVDKVTRLNGIVTSIDKYNDRRSRLSVKVPPQELDAFVASLENVGTIEAHSFSAKDITDEMVDIDARVKNLQLLKERYRALLNKATEIAEIIQIEKELTKIQTEIDSINGRRHFLKGQVELSTVNILLTKEITYGPLGYVFKGMYWVFVKLFVID